MKSLIAEKAKRNNAKIQEDAKANKKLVANQKNTLKNEQPKQSKQEKVEIMPETSTIMLGVK
ncbi:MAG: hypothetical protein J6Q13_00165 [Clostridia bacterium]|nr:hypothetical protein [Clostridia bacterium]